MDSIEHRYSVASSLTSSINDRDIATCSLATHFSDLRQCLPRAPLPQRLARILHGSFEPGGSSVRITTSDSLLSQLRLGEDGQISHAIAKVRRRNLMR